LNIYYIKANKLYTLKALKASPIVCVVGEKPVASTPQHKRALQHTEQDVLIVFFKEREVEKHKIGLRDKSLYKP